jgi:hypothetical protein
MPKYFQDKVAGYYLYYTKHCIVEAMHAHASDKRMTEGDLPSFLSGLMAALLCRKKEN